MQYFFFLFVSLFDKRFLKVKNDKQTVRIVKSV